jgi:hypothetical protein
MRMVSVSISWLVRPLIYSAASSMGSWRGSGSTASSLANSATRLRFPAASMRSINSRRHPFDLRYGQDLPETAWERCAEVLDHYDVLRIMKQPW